MAHILHVMKYTSLQNMDEFINIGNIIMIIIVC